MDTVRNHKEIKHNETYEHAFVLPFGHNALLVDF
jgi:hypothetical protein